MTKKALVAMSGGVDSSVAAFLTKESGYETAGATMELFGGENGRLNADDIKDAKAVAGRLGIKYEVFDFTKEFDECVVSPFVESYESGSTPNPCVDCNRRLKFDAFFRKGRELGFDTVVTGHYARIECDEETGKYLLKKAVSEAKDQSYVLYTLSQDQLAHASFPIGGLTKDEVRKIAEEQGFANASKSESQDICFIPEGKYHDFIKEYSGKDYPPGDFVDSGGNVLGRHSGIINYTVGQRKGLGLALKKPMYVVEIDAASNRVILGDNDDLFERELTAGDFNWISGNAPEGEIRCTAKIRYKHAEAPATARVTENGNVIVTFDEPQRAITAGQSAVLYDGDTVLGGGKILRVTHCNA